MPHSRRGQPDRAGGVACRAPRSTGRRRPRRGARRRAAADVRRIARVAGRRAVADVAAAAVGDLVELSLPRNTAPALRRRRTTSASSVAMRSANTALAAVVAWPADVDHVLEPDSARRGAVRGRGRASSSGGGGAACSSASSPGCTVRNACSVGSRRAMRSRQSWVASTGRQPPRPERGAELGDREQGGIAGGLHRRHRAIAMLELRQRAAPLAAPQAGGSLPLPRGRTRRS